MKALKTFYVPDFFSSNSATACRSFAVVDEAVKVTKIITRPKAVWSECRLKKPICDTELY